MSSRALVAILKEACWILSMNALCAVNRDCRSCAGMVKNIGGTPPDRIHNMLMTFFANKPVHFPLLLVCPALRRGRGFSSLGNLTQ